MSETETMRFVRERTTIPIPQVHNAYVDDESGMVRIVMEFIEGENLDSAWDNYTDAEKESVISQLRGYMEELRQIKGFFIGSVDNSWCNDHYFDDKRGAYGPPFASEAEFDRGISQALKEAKLKTGSNLTATSFKKS